MGQGFRLLLTFILSFVWIPLSHAEPDKDSILGSMKREAAINEFEEIFNRTSTRTENEWNKRINQKNLKVFGKEPKVQVGRALTAEAIQQWELDKLVPGIQPTSGPLAPGDVIKLNPHQNYSQAIDRFIESRMARESRIATSDMLDAEFVENKELEYIVRDAETKWGKDSESFKKFQKYTEDYKDLAFAKAQKAIEMEQHKKAKKAIAAVKKRSDKSFGKEQLEDILRSMNARSLSDEQVARVETALKKVQAGSRKSLNVPEVLKKVTKPHASAACLKRVVSSFF